jgi:hypothetical protein
VADSAPGRVVRLLDLMGPSLRKEERTRNSRKL